MPYATGAVDAPFAGTLVVLSAGAAEDAGGGASGTSAEFAAELAGGPAAEVLAGAMYGLTGATYGLLADGYATLTGAVTAFADG